MPSTPEPPSPDARVPRLRRFLLLYLGVAVATCTVFAVRYAVLDYTWVFAANLVAAALIAAALLAVYRARRFTTLTALTQIAAAVLLVHIVIITALSGGPLSSSAFWLVGVLAGVTQALGPSAGLRWAGACLVGVGVSAASGSIPDLPAYPLGAFEHMGGTATLLLVVYFFAAASSRAHQAEAALANERAALAEREAEINRKRRDSALELARTKDELFAMISHEMRSPLHAMLGLNGLLASSPLDAEQRSLVADVSASGDTLLALINDLLDYSRLEAGRMNLASLPFDVRATIDQALGVVAPMVGQKPVILVARVDEDVPEEITGDELRFGQVLVNLLSNAVKFTERGRVALHAALTADGRELEITVEDTGLGIPAARLPHIFEPFVQADASTTRRFGGTGLGLSIARRIVEAMRGSVSASSEEGRGSRFTLRLPCLAATPLDPEPRPLEGRTAALVIDDEEERRAALVLCDRLGVDARNPPRGLADCVIADIESAATIDVRALGHKVVWIDRAGEPPGPVVRRPLRARTLEVALRVALELPEAPRVAGGSIRSSSALRVLLVDDTPVNLTVGRKMLEQLGHEVVCVAGGREALARLAEERFDVVLLDLRMPEIDGPSVARTFREANPSRPEVLIGMSADAGASGTAIEAGMQAFLTKPAGIEELWRALRTAVRRSSLPDVPANRTPSRPLESAPDLPTTRTPSRALESLRKLNVPEEEIARLVSAFVKDARALARDAVEAAIAGDRETATRCAHSLRGSAPMFGAVSCVEAARRLEDDASAAPPEELERLARELVMACDADARALGSG